MADPLGGRWEGCEKKLKCDNVNQTLSMTSELVPTGLGKAMRSAADHPIFEPEHHPIRTPRLSLRAVRGEANNPWEDYSAKRG